MWELLAEVGKDVAESFNLTGGTTITVAKPYCAPARGIVEGVLTRYGVKILKYEERTVGMNFREFARRMRIEMKTGENLKYGPLAVMFLPMAQQARVTVKDEQANWAEYLLLRTQKLYRVGAYLNPKNQAYADQHGGRLPPAWADKRPWIEPSCSEGKELWSTVKRMTKPIQKGRK